MKLQKHLYAFYLAPAVLALTLTVASCSSTTSENAAVPETAPTTAQTTVASPRVDDPLEVTVFAQDMIRDLQAAPIPVGSSSNGNNILELIHQMALQGRLPIGTRVHLPGLDGLRTSLWDGSKAAPVLEVFAPVPGKVELYRSGYSICLTIGSAPAETFSLSEPLAGELACQW